MRNGQHLSTRGKRYLYRRGRLIDRETGLTEHISPMVAKLLDRRLVDFEVSKPVRLPFRNILTIHDLTPKARQHVRIVDRMGAKFMEIAK